MLSGQRVHDVMGGEKAIVTWSDTADAALGRMRGLGCDRLAVIDPYGDRHLRAHRVARLSAARRLARLDIGRGPDAARAVLVREDDPLSKVLLSMERLKTDTLAVLDRRGRVVGTIQRDHGGGRPPSAARGPTPATDATT